MKKKGIFIVFLLIILVVPFFYPVLPIISGKLQTQKVLKELYSNLSVYNSGYKATWTDIYFFSFDPILKIFQKKIKIPNANLFNSTLTENGFLVTPNGFYADGIDLSPSYDFDTIHRLSYAFFYDKNGIGFDNLKINGLFLKNPEFFEDYNFVCNEGYKLYPPKNFRTNYYVKDGKKIIGLKWDSKSYYIIPTDYSKDFKIIYGECVSPTYYTKNNKNVFYYDKIIDGADPETFEVVIKLSNFNKYIKQQNIKNYPKNYAKDKNYYYGDGEILTGKFLDMLLKHNNK